MLNCKSKILLLCTCFFLLFTGTVWSAPAKNLETGELNLDLMIHDSTDAYNGNFSYKMTHTLVVGMDRNKWKNGYSTNESYAEFSLENSPAFRCIVGSINIDSIDKTFFGGAIGDNIGSDWDYYVSYIKASSNISETQAGLHYVLTDDTKLNLNYRVLDYNDTKYKGFYWGVTFHFKTE